MEQKVLIHLPVIVTFKSAEGIAFPNRHPDFGVNDILDFLTQMWQFEYAIIPCLIAYVIFDIPIIYRRVTRRLYVPIYFAFFPFGYSDELYARYFDEDEFCTVGGPIREDEITNFRTKIIWVSVLSLALTMALSPFIAAMFSHYYLTTPQQNQFFYTLALMKGLLLTWSLYDLRWQYTVTDVVPTGYIATIYAVYWIALLTFYDRGLTWIAEQDEAGGLGAIANGLLDFFIYDIGVGILFVGLIGFLVPWRLTRGTARPVGNDEE